MWRQLTARRLRRTLTAFVALSAVAVTSAPAQAGTAQAVQKGLTSLVRDNGFPAAMAALRDRHGNTRFYAAGVGNVNTGAPVPVDGQIRIASATKMFTATVVLQLVGEGKINLDGAVDTYLPNLLRGDGIDGRNITVRQLLQHTSGLPEYYTVDFLATQHIYAEPRELLDRSLAQKATFPPGTGWRYSNTNYVVAGLLAQKITGRPISEEITTRIIDRIGLRHTYWPGVGDQTIREPHAHGYLAKKPGTPRIDVTRMDPSWGWAAGQLIASPGDINRFLAALLGGELLKPQQLGQMRSTVEAPGLPAGWQYGLGLVRIDLSCGGYGWGHGGDIDGYENRNAITDDGRAATVAVTALPADEQSAGQVNAVLDAAICGKSEIKSTTGVSGVRSS
jgi:D-alanyl-D-alanine carboxypeptidase